MIRLLAEGARVRLDGDVVANGGNGAGGQSGGGAGGTVRLTAAYLEGSGRIEAKGGGGTFYNTTGGGGGGRIAICLPRAGDDPTTSPRSSTPPAGSTTRRYRAAPTAAAAPGRCSRRSWTPTPGCRRRDGCGSPTRSPRRGRR